MRRADNILGHPLAEQDSTISIAVTVDVAAGRQTATLDYNNIPVQDLVYLATAMRPIVYLESEPIYFSRLTSQIEREHAAFRGKLKPYRQAFKSWLTTPIVRTLTLGEIPQHLWSAEPIATFTPSDPLVDQADGVEVAGTTSDMHYALLYFYGEHWHSDDAKAAEYAAADAHTREFIAKCAELRTMGAIPYVRTLHRWVTEVRALGMDI